MILTSRNEGIPLALVEGMAAGLPIIATAVGGVPDVVADGETGRLAAAGDALALAGAILELADDPRSGAHGPRRPRAGPRPLLRGPDDGRLRPDLPRDGGVLSRSGTRGPRDDDGGAVMTRPLNVVVVAAELPYPLTAGNRIRTWNLARRLAAPSDHLHRPPARQRGRGAGRAGAGGGRVDTGGPGSSPQSGPGVLRAARRRFGLAASLLGDLVR